VAEVEAWDFTVEPEIPSWFVATRKLGRKTFRLLMAKSLAGEDFLVIDLSRQGGDVLREVPEPA
jgi:hypothetical protein